MTDFPEFVDIQADSYRERYLSNVVRSDFDSGFAKQRNEYKSTFKQISFSFRFAGHRYNDFISWYYGVQNGALWFWFWDAQSQAKVRARMVEHDLDLQPRDDQMRTFESSITLEVFNG